MFFKKLFGFGGTPKPKIEEEETQNEPIKKEKTIHKKEKPKPKPKKAHKIPEKDDDGIKDLLKDMHSDDEPEEINNEDFKDDIDL